MKTEKTAVLISGASSGIGKACAMYLDKLGFKVYAGVRKTIDAEELKTIASPKLRPVILDVTSKEAIISVREMIEKKW